MNTSVTSEDVVGRFRSLGNRHRQYISIYDIQKVKDQRAKEKMLLRSLQQRSGKDCPTDEIMSHLINIDSSKLSKVIKTEFYNPAVMKITSCINKTVVDYYDRSNKSVQEWFSNSRKIGEESADGIVFKTDIREEDGVVVLKSPRKISAESNDQFVHELFIGKMALNDSRNDIPNFAYTFDGFNCEGSGIDKDGKGILCGGISGKSVQYIIYENIEPSISVKSYLDNATPGSYLSLIMQIIFTTYYGYLKFDWTHYDLHTNNVLMREVKIKKRKFCIKYPIDGKEYYVRSTHVATIIDYGRSHIKINGNHYGYFLERGEIYPAKSFPMFDIYKFLMLTARYLYHSEHPSCNKCLDVAENIFSFFNTEETIEQAIELQYEARYQLPGLEAVKSMFKISDLIRHIRKTIPKLFWHVVKITKKNAYFPVLNCSDMSCQNLNELYTATGLVGTYNGLYHINSLSDYHLQKDILIKQSNGFEHLKNSYTTKAYYDHMHAHFKKCETLVRSFEHLAENLIIEEDTYFNHDRISELENFELFGNVWINYLIQNFNDVILLNRICDTIHRNLEIGLETTTDFNDLEVCAKLKDIFDSQTITEMTDERVRNARLLAKDLHSYSRLVQKGNIDRQTYDNINKLIGTLNLLI